MALRAATLNATGGPVQCGCSRDLQRAIVVVVVSASSPSRRAVRWYARRRPAGRRCLAPPAASSRARAGKHEGPDGDDEAADKDNAEALGILGHAFPLVATARFRAK